LPKGIAAQTAAAAETAFDTTDNRTSIQRSKYFEVLRRESGNKLKPPVLGHRLAQALLIAASV
jgi:hypothetical protein